MSDVREGLGRDEERDPRDDEVLAELRDAWRAASAPDPAPELGAGDDASRAVAAWLRGAWDTLEAPPVPVATARALAARARRPLPAERVTPPRSVASRVAWIGLAAAAALVLWLALGRARQDGPGHGTDVAVAPPTNANTPGPAPDPAPIEVEDVTPERMELRSGPVRLVLLNGWTDEASETETR